MELILVIKSVCGAVQKGQSVLKFFEDEMSNIIEQIGDIEYQSAVKALRDARISNHPSREIESAITCLRTAQHAFYSTPLERIILTSKKQARFFKKSIEACVLLVTCYHYLNEYKLKASYLTILGDSYYYYTRFMDQSFWENHPANFEPELQTALVELCAALGIKEFWIPHPYYFTFYNGAISEPLNEPWRQHQIDLIATSKSGARWLSNVVCGRAKYHRYGDGGQHKFLLRPPRGSEGRS